MKYGTNLLNKLYLQTFRWRQRELEHHGFFTQEQEPIIFDQGEWIVTQDRGLSILGSGFKTLDKLQNQDGGPRTVVEQSRTSANQLKLKVFKFV